LPPGRRSPSRPSRPPQRLAERPLQNCRAPAPMNTLAEAPSVDAITNALSRLGRTAHEVADMLQAAAVRGKRGDASFSNPVVRSPNRPLDTGPRLTTSVGGDRLLVEYPDHTEEYALPEPVKEFLNGFHAGQYPDLESV